MWREKTKHGKEKKKKKEEKYAQKGEKKNRHLIFFLSVGVRLEILKLTLITINCLMKHNNLSC